MPSESPRSDDDRSVPSDPTDAAAGIDQEALYGTVRRAVEDAILDAVGTMLAVAVGTAIGIAGASFLLRTATDSGLSVPVLAAGVWLTAIGFYVVASTLGVVQPVRDWF
ncbi:MULTISPECIES: hypothetical protein [Halolamina]|uniref:Uncharacterized protein n=1 Tax=Halolamina pelagica TaxID=699431 RepID=A0A1I5P248_9EURY|nr:MULTISPECIES: hypothetical protein [Halolamina]NHX36592.1 hypothetical protein [Halolamina sp. R1-12]SFP28158.1 hypothetical protein SAMN05216277_102311 [Halolamina pelagica]